MLKYRTTDRTTPTNPRCDSLGNQQTTIIHAYYPRSVSYFQLPRQHRNASHNMPVGNYGTEYTSAQYLCHSRNSSHAPRFGTKTYYGIPVNDYHSSSNHSQPPRHYSTHSSHQTVRKATPEDAIKHSISAGYSLENWDPTEEPIKVCGSVFDAYSLGQWIYDWTVSHYGPNTPFSDIAGDLQMLLIVLAGKIKHAERILPEATTQNQELLQRHIDSGKLLIDKLKTLIKACEGPMLKHIDRNKKQLGEEAGTAFVDTFFGRDHQLEETQRFMQSVCEWIHQLDVELEEAVDELEADLYAPLRRLMINPSP